MSHGPQYKSSTNAEQVGADVDVKGQTVIVTGGNSGIGFETARVFASRGANVILACRSAEAGPAAAKQIEESTGQKVMFEQLDLNSLASVDAFAARFKADHTELKYLINNAGIMSIKNFELTAFGIEKQFGVNHVGHFHLTNLLMEPLRAAKPSRVVNVSSAAHEMAHKQFMSNMPPTPERYGRWANYGDSKLANILFSKELNKREEENGVTAYSLHPGVIKTNLHRNNVMAKVFYNLASIFMKSIPQGAATTVFCALDPRAEPGGFHSDCKPKGSKRPEVDDAEAAAELWAISEKIVAKGDVVSNEKEVGGEETKTQ
jgi:retinol dehydrogenase-12